MKKLKMVLPILAFVFATATAFTTKPGEKDFTSKDGGVPGNCITGTLDQTNCDTVDHSEGRCTINSHAKNAFNTSNMSCLTALFINN
jgi:uncharacterized protein DUF6520